MKKDSSSNNYSADSFIVDYQRQLKEKQDAGFNSENLLGDRLSKSDHQDHDDQIPDLNVSISHVENQLISQFREYKEIKSKLDDAKRQLHLSSQIQVSVDNLKELEHAYSQRKKSLDDNYRIAKDDYESTLIHLKRDIDRMISDKDHVVQMIKKEELKAKYDVRVSFEQDQLLQSESFYFDWCKNLSYYSCLEEDAKQKYDDFIIELDTKKDLSKKRYDFDCDQLVAEFNKKREDLDVGLAQKKQDVLQSIDLMNQSFQDQVDSTQQVLDEQYACLKFEFDSLHGVFHMLILSTEETLDITKKKSVDTLLEFSEQLDQKRDMWELEKVNSVEAIDQEKFKWEEERQSILRDLDTQKLTITNEIEQLRHQFLSEKNNWKLQQETLMDDYEQKKELLIRDINGLESRKHEYELAALKQSETLESYDLVMFEREQEFECVRQHMVQALEKKRQSKLDDLELEFLDKKNKFSSQLKQLEDRQKLDFSERLDSFETDLSQRRRLFEEDLVNRRQKIVEECKRDQKIEFDHLLDFEKDKHLKQKNVLLDQIETLTHDLQQQDSSVKDQLQGYQDQIKDLQDENSRLADNVSTIEDLTRRKTIVSYEDKYKQSLELYKQQSQKDIQSLKSVNAVLDTDLKKKELQLRDFQLQVKRLESQLNKYLIMNHDAKIEKPFQAKQKVVRNINYKRGL